MDEQFKNKINLRIRSNSSISHAYVPVSSVAMVILALIPSPSRLTVDTFTVYFV